MWETRVRSLGQEDTLEKELATHSSILTWRNHGQRSLAGYSPWSGKELDRPERLTHTHTPISVAPAMAASAGTALSENKYPTTRPNNHSSVLAWRIPGTGEPGGLSSMGSHRVGHDWSGLAAAAADPINIFWTSPSNKGLPTLLLYLPLPVAPVSFKSFSDCHLPSFLWIH